MLDTNLVIATCGFLACLTAGWAFLRYGVKHGLMREKIRGDFRGNYLTGKAAKKRGLFLIGLGLFNLASAVVMGVYVYVRFHTSL